MQTELIKQLLEAGVHFGHQTKRWNPKMKKFIFGSRSGIYIIDLEKTADSLSKAMEFLTDLAAQGKTVLFVGTKRQAQEIIKEEAIKCGMFYVSQRWLGGMLTNFQTIKKSINRLKSIEKMREDGTFKALTKKEVSLLIKEKEKLNKNLVGIVNMESAPGAIVIVDSMKEANAIHEARLLGIPVVGLIDTNCNPDEIDYLIPGNDDAIKAIKLVVSMLADSVIEGRKRFLSYLADQEITKKKETQDAAGAKSEELEDVKIPEEIEDALVSKLVEPEEEAKPKVKPRRAEDDKASIKRKAK